MSNRFLASLACAALSITATAAFAQTPYRIENRWVVGGEGGWDYLIADSGAHRLYITHASKVEVVDTNTGKVIGAIAGLTRTHGVVLSPDGKTGYISDGGANMVVVFDPSNLTVITKIPVGRNPDGIAYEPSTNTVWAFNGASNDATVVDAQQNKVVGTIKLPGKPEFPQVDGKGTLFVNIEDKNSIVRLDAKTQTATATWPLKGCESPSGMAMDLSGMRLFSVCDGKKMAVTDANTGKSLATASIGDGPDAAGYDPKNKLAFSSNGDSTLTIVDAGKPGYPVLQTLATEKGARTMAYDAASDKVYLVTSKFAPADPAKPRARPTPLPGTFTVLVVGR